MRRRRHLACLSLLYHPRSDESLALKDSQPRLGGSAESYLKRAAEAQARARSEHASHFAELAVQWSNLAAQAKALEATQDRSWIVQALAELGPEATDFGHILQRAGFDVVAYVDRNEDLSILVGDKIAAVRHYYTWGVNELRVAPFQAPLAVLNRIIKDAPISQSLKQKLSQSAALSRAHKDTVYERDELQLRDLLSPSDHYVPLLVFGDSHAAYYHNHAPMVDAGWLPVPYICLAGSARGLINAESRSGYGRLISAFINKNYDVIEASRAAVVFKFGQVDLEFVFNFTRMKLGSPDFDYLEFHRFMLETCEHYFSYLKCVKGLMPLGTPFVVASAFPPVLSDVHLRAGYTKVHADVAFANLSSDVMDRLMLVISEYEMPTLRLRTYLHHLFNSELAARASASGWIYQDEFTGFLDATGVVAAPYVEITQGSDHHLDFNAAATRAASGRSGLALKCLIDQVRLDEREHPNLDLARDVEA